MSSLLDPRAPSASMRLRTGPLIAATCLVSCSDPKLPDPNVEVDIFDHAPSGEQPAANSDLGSQPQVDWEGPEVEPGPEAIWGGLGVGITEIDCALWWSLAGEETDCADCSLAFELVGDTLGDSCGGLGTSWIEFRLEIIDGRAYGFYEYWGAVEYGGGLLTWDGLREGYGYGYRYYGYLHY